MNKLELKEKTGNGKLITFCGLDGSGKTSMIRRLETKLKDSGVVAKLTKQPTKEMRNTDIFRTYMDCVDHGNYEYRALSLMAAADRIQHTKQVIEPWLDQGEFVISDRYFYSCLANLRARGYKDDKWIYEIASDIVKPSVCFFMDIPVEMAMQRVRNRKEEKDRYIDLELQFRLREEYLSIAEDVGGIVISTTQTEEECFRQIWGEILAIQGDLIKNTDYLRTIVTVIHQYTAWDGAIEFEMRIEEDLGLDSLKRTQFVCALEESFGIRFKLEDLEPDNFRKIEDIYKIVKKYMEQKCCGII